MNSESARVSVVTATRDRPAMLRRALLSVAAQSYGSVVCIVADDGSSPAHEPDYAAVVSEFGPRVRCFKAREAGAPRSGPGAARNRAMERADTDYIAFLDDDDQWVDPEHLATAVSALDATGAEFFFANMRGVRGGEVVIGDFLPNTRELVSGPPLLESPQVHRVTLDAFSGAMRHHYVHPNTMVIRRSLRERVGLFQEKIRFAEDVDWALRLGDEARGILFRPAFVAHIRLPEHDSSSLWESEFNHLLDDATAAQHARAHARNPQTIRTALAKEAWAYRQLSRVLVHEHPASARSFARQAFVFPTFGAIGNWAAVEVRSRL